MRSTLAKSTLHIEGMHCAGCVDAVTAALRRLPTVHVERAALGAVTLVRDPVAIPWSAVVGAVNRAGYQVGDAAGLSQHPVRHGGCCGGHAADRAASVARRASSSCGCRR